MILPVIAIIAVVARGPEPRGGSAGGVHHAWSLFSRWQEFGDPTAVVVTLVSPTLEGEVFTMYGHWMPPLDLRETDPAEYDRLHAIASYANDALVAELDARLGCGGGGSGGGGADFNGDGRVNSSDFFEFMQVFMAGE